MTLNVIFVDVKRGYRKKIEKSHSWGTNIKSPADAGQIEEKMDKWIVDHSGDIHNIKFLKRIFINSRDCSDVMKYWIEANIENDKESKFLSEETDRPEESKGLYKLLLKFLDSKENSVFSFCKDSLYIGIYPNR